MANYNGEVLDALRMTQTLLALIANDPENPDNGILAAKQFNYNKNVIERRTTTT